MAGEEGGRRTGPEGTWPWRWGTAGWLFLGVVGAVVILGPAYSKMRQVVIPLVIAVVVGILLEPAVSFMARHHIPRWLATLLVMVAIVTAVAGFATPTVYGIATQAGAIGKQVEGAVNRSQDWPDNLEVSGSFAQWVQQQVEEAWPSITNGIAKELAGSPHGPTSFLVGSFAGFFTLMFILAAGGASKEWVAGHLGAPKQTGDMIMGEAYSSVRGRFKGATTIAAFDGALIVAVPLIPRLPLVGAIGLVSFKPCYMPPFGGYIGGAFAVLTAPASKGLDAAVIMPVLGVLIHAVPQNQVQAIAYGKTLDLHPAIAPLVTLIGAVFGGIFGAILAVPLTAVVLKVSGEPKRAHAAGRSSPGYGAVPPAAKGG